MAGMYTQSFYHMRLQHKASRTAHSILIEYTLPTLVQIGEVHPASLRDWVMKMKRRKKQEGCAFGPGNKFPGYAPVSLRD